MSDRGKGPELRPSDEGRSLGQRLRQRLGGVAVERYRTARQAFASAGTLAIGANRPAVVCWIAGPHGWLVSLNPPPNLPGVRRVLELIPQGQTFLNSEL